MRVGVREREDRLSMDVRRSQSGARSVEVGDAILVVDLHHVPMACGVQRFPPLAQVAQLDLGPDVATSRESSRIARRTSVDADGSRWQRASSAPSARAARAQASSPSAHRTMIGRCQPSRVRRHPSLPRIPSTVMSTTATSASDRASASSASEEPLASLRSTVKSTTGEAGIEIGDERRHLRATDHQDARAVPPFRLHTALPLRVISNMAVIVP